MKAEDASDLMDQDKSEDNFKRRAAIAIAFFAMLLAITGLGGNNATKEALNQFDRGGHTLHINLYEYQSGPCGNFSSGYDTATGEPGIPAEGGGTTTDFLEIAKCATWLGPNQPGINDDLGLPPYDPSVCPDGSDDPEICDPN